jgi:hypothetical protein
MAFKSTSRGFILAVSGLITPEARASAAAFSSVALADVLDALVSIGLIHKSRSIRYGLLWDDGGPSYSAAKHLAFGRCKRCSSLSADMA